MRAYTLALLSKLTEDGKKIEDKDIVEWVNEKVSEKKRNTSTVCCALEVRQSFEAIPYEKKFHHKLKIMIMIIRVFVLFALGSSC